MNESDNIALQIQQLYVGPVDPIGDNIEAYLNTHPEIAAQTYVSLYGAPNATWDSIDSVGLGKNFGVGFFVQDVATEVLYRCSDATPGAAVWDIIIQQEQ